MEVLIMTERRKVGYRNDLTAVYCFLLLSSQDDG